MQINCNLMKILKFTLYLMQLAEHSSIFSTHFIISVETSVPLQFHFQYN